MVLGLRLENAGALLRAFIGKNRRNAMQNLLLSTIAAPVLAQQPSAPGGAGNSTFLIFMVLMFAAMWFLMIAPQRKKQKEHEKMVKALATGDEILTTGGIFGVVTNVKDDRLVVRIAEGTKVEIGRAFVQTVLKKAASS
jgi:preprotein translocase subunit YajC